MKKLSLFLNKTNTKIRFQEFTDNVSGNTSYIHEIADFYETFPTNIMGIKDKSKYQAIMRRLRGSISLDNIYIAKNDTHLAIFDPSKSVLLAVDIESSSIFVASVHNMIVNSKGNAQCNSDAVLLRKRVRVDNLLAVKPFIDPREDELSILRKQVADLQKQNGEKDIMIAELQKIAAEYKELVAAKQSLERQVEEERAHSTSLSEENAKLRQLVQKLRNNENVESEAVQEQVAEQPVQQEIEEASSSELNVPLCKQVWCETSAFRKRMLSERLSEDEITELTKNLEIGFDWFFDQRELLGLTQSRQNMTEQPDNALTNIRNAIELYEEQHESN
ncbi:hypothetical protein QTV37_003486 [Vibrio parahaemolyticus]|nr:hypothetical protein [Vibrio parahaemolyticus]